LTYFRLHTRASFVRRELLPRRRLLSGQALLKLAGKLLCLLIRELELTVHDQAQLASAGILELRFLDGRSFLRGSRGCGLEVCALLQGGDEHRGDLLT